ncbi:hypothetical protein J4450_06965 [Candidatus Micrarchaeota archaeon]|nr:hypothetical protein [Candidatus Micrarchaeota archaeon]
MDSNELTKRINTEGLAFLFNAVKSDTLFNSLSQALEDNSVKEALANMLISEGEKTKLDNKKYSVLFSILNDTVFSDKLIELMTSNEGIGILKKVVSSDGGEALVLGAMDANYTSAHAFVNKLLKRRIGRRLVVELVIAASLNDNIKVGASEISQSMLSNKGKEFLSLISDIKNLQQAFSDDTQSEKILDYLKANSQEAALVLSNKLNDKEYTIQLISVLTSESGKTFCSLIGKSGFGKKIGGGKLWHTKGGRDFVHEMLKKEDGAYAIYAIVTGMSVAEFIAYTAKLEGE